PSGIIGLISTDDSNVLGGSRCNVLGGSPNVLGERSKVLGQPCNVLAPGIQRLGYVPPARTPGNVIVDGCGCATCSGRSCSCGAALWPSVSMNARRTTSCTSDCSRNRTSAFVGCTLTSSASGDISMNRCTSGLRSLIDAWL